MHVIRVLSSYFDHKTTFTVLKLLELIQIISIGISKYNN